MCGFVGKYYFTRHASPCDDINKMSASIIHRGPDSYGGYDDDRLKLGFRRLSIIDTLKGNQPLYNENNEILVVANGEIYNYKETKYLLQKKGHQFKTGSDCEVLVHLYEEFDLDFVTRLNGMFAFCLYDKKHEKLILGRDRIGIKPLYYSIKKDLLVFASEIKAVLQATEIDSIESPDVLQEYLCFRFLSGSRTFFSGIELLQPGTILEVSPNGVDSAYYWRPQFTQESSRSKNTVQAIRETLHGSVSRQLMSDVPLGTQLSGGMDSSWVSFLSANDVPGMKSFSVAFSDPNFDETSEAKKIAKIAGLEYHQVISDPIIFAESLPIAIWHNDEPLTHANSVEIYNLCRYARQHVKVLLTGEGADELFGGYPRYFLPHIIEFYGSLPSIFRLAFRNGLDWVFRERGKKPSSFLGMSPRDLIFWNAAFTPPNKVAWLMDKDHLNLDSRRQIQDRSWCEQLNTLDNLLLYEIQTYLQPILLRQDKMSMGASVEARVPILDNEMIDLALSIKASKKMKRFQPKYLLKKAASCDLPSQIINKRKIGFSVPVGNWMRKDGSLNKYLENVNDHCSDLPGINPQKLGLLIQEHLTNSADHQDILWPLINYVIWRDVFFHGGGKRA